MSTKKLQILGTLGDSLSLDTTLSQEGYAADAKAVGDALALKADIEDAKVVLVNLTAAEEEGAYTADRNYEEVVEAIDAGRTVVAVLDGTRHNYLFEEGGELVFTANVADWMSAVFFSPDIVVVEDFPIALADQIPTKVSQLENDSGFITSVPVSSVNGKTGAVQLTASDVGALSDTTVIPDAYTHPDTHPVSMITGLATVATSGKYSDLSGTPTIPTVPSTLPNPSALTINGTTYNGATAVDMTDIINALIDSKLGVIENGSY